MSARNTRLGLGILFTLACLATPQSAQAQVLCGDGSGSGGGRGACSGHGGVDKVATQKAKDADKADKARAKAEAKAAKTQARSNAKAAGPLAKPSATVIAPAKPERTTASRSDKLKCADGTMSSAFGRGACSGHGGIAGTAAGSGVQGGNVTPRPEERSVPAAAPSPRSTGSPSVATSRPTNTTNGSGAREDNNPAGAIAHCKDGMYSHSAHRQGACSRHGGVSQWMTGN